MRQMRDEIRVYNIEHMGVNFSFGVIFRPPAITFTTSFETRIFATHLSQSNNLAIQQAGK